MKNIKYNFRGERFIVTGASSEIGSRIALDLAEAGGVVLAVSQCGQKLRLLKEREPERIEIVEADPKDVDAMAAAVCAFVEAQGKVKGCVHAAGIACGGSALRRNIAKQHVINAEFWTGIHLMGICIKRQYYAQGASNVLFSRGIADCGEQPLFPCAASKAASESAVKTVAKEMGGKGYRVNAIEFGWIKTHRNDSLEGEAEGDTWEKRHVLGAGGAADVSHMTLFLLSDAARWITGTNMTVDGGFSAS